jgi:hypothetical protein
MDFNIDCSSSSNNEIYRDEKGYGKRNLIVADWRDCDLLVEESLKIISGMIVIVRKENWENA